MARIYLSFASDSRFLGGCVVEAQSVETAVARASELGINPGGEVMGFQVPKGTENIMPLNRLLSQEELEAFDGGRRGKKWGELSEEERSKVQEHISVVCEEHNET